nr:PREDICTED: fibroblast growth factor receptor 2-like [Bemisia tabaci]
MRSLGPTIAIGVWWALVSLVTASLDYCCVDMIASAKAPWMQFTKELSSQEFSVTNSLKSLHCCAKGYRSIEWYKDGKPYPWRRDVSNMILYPESANQTVYTHAVTARDAGNYTCIVRNDSSSISHTIHLSTFDKTGYVDAPLPTYQLANEQYAKVGSTVRLFCEAFVGHIDLPDAKNQVEWIRLGENQTLEGNERFSQKQISREDGQIIGKYLEISSVHRSDFGNYMCTISNSGDQTIQLITTLREEEWFSMQVADYTDWGWMVFLVCSLISSILIVCLVLRRYCFHSYG